MYEFYKVTVRDEVLKRARKDLKIIYEDIPQTEGCSANLANCKAWCCEHQNPSLFYSEFLNTYWNINHSWSKEKLGKLFISAVRTYLDNNPTKGCVFWDKESKLCMQHQTRPFNCRTYGQVPDEDFKPRYERLKVLYADKSNAVVRDQCNLVKSVGSRPTSQQMNDWFEQIKMVEKDVLGENRLQLKGHKSIIHDGDGGSYRTFHDHLLLQMAPISMLDELTRLRTEATEADREAFVKNLESDLEKALHEPDQSKGN